MEDHLGKEATRFHSEKEMSEEREPLSDPQEGRSSRCQTERGSKVCWDAEQFDRHLPSCGNANIASQPLLKRQPIMRSLRTGQGCR